MPVHVLVLLALRVLVIGAATGTIALVARWPPIATSALVCAPESPHRADQPGRFRRHRRSTRSSTWRPRTNRLHPCRTELPLSLGLPTDRRGGRLCWTAAEAASLESSKASRRPHGAARVRPHGQYTEHSRALRVIRARNSAGRLFCELMGWRAGKAWSSLPIGHPRSGHHRGDARPQVAAADRVVVEECSQVPSVILRRVVACGRADRIGAGSQALSTTIAAEQRREGCLCASTWLIRARESR